MKNKIFALGATLLLLTAWSCREENDVLKTYDHNDVLVFAAADTSFAAKFQIMWEGMNQYYNIWDYEAEQGVNWDAIYDEYYPQFAALDQRGKDETVTDDELKTLMGKVLSPLHDGHFHFDIMNHKTGNMVVYNPSQERNKMREDFALAQTFAPNLAYYANPANQQIETDENGTPFYLEHSTRIQEVLAPFYKTPGYGYQWIEAKIKEMEALSAPTEMQAFQLQQLKELYQGLTVYRQNPANINLYNSLQSKYDFLNVPGFDYFDPGFLQNGSRFIFALLKGNIAYFHVSNFYMTPYLNDAKSVQTFNMNNPATLNHVQRMREVWVKWINVVQLLHKAGTLKGVIIDVRSNTGGMISDYQYCLGALLPSGGYQIGYNRVKRGYGRYDYSTLMPAIAGTMSEPHEVIDDIPVALLCNCYTVSMGEMTTLGAKIMPNATVIGKRTWGGLCPLNANQTFSLNYTGYIGVEGVTCVYGYVPYMAALNLDKKFMEGQGIEPDIEVGLNTTMFASGEDSQLNRALQLIRDEN